MTSIRYLVLTAVLASGLAFASAQAAARPAPAVLAQREWQADSLHERAVRLLGHRTLEGRRAAIRALERATQLVPGRPEYEMLLARTYLDAGFRRQAMRRFERVASMAPSDAEARFGLARVWRLDYLKYVDTTSLARSTAHLRAACRLDSSHTEAWLMMSSLLIERGGVPEAAEAAARAARTAPGSPEALIAVASTHWRLGRVALADSVFRDAIPRLRRNVRERFEDIAPLVTEADTARYNRLGAEQRGEFARRFWLEHDPDLATPANEVQLEYWARVAQSFFLYYDTKHREWDERGEVYVRFGPPGKVLYNPIGVSLYERASAGSSVAFPINVLVWSYPELGMSVMLKDRVLSEYYLLQRFDDHEPDPHPDPEVLARSGRLATAGARGVFPVRAPGVRALPLRTSIARFALERATHVLASLEVQAQPSDSIGAECVVLDSLMHEVARQRSGLSPSACGADSFRIADFAQDLPPGRYLVGLSAGDARRRGSVRASIEIARPDSVLAMSDVVVTCGISPAGEPAVRLTANPGARVRGDDPLTAYFEVHGLVTDEGGLAHFEVGWTVRSDEKDPRVWAQRVFSRRAATPDIEAYRAETNVGPLRRQFVSVPVRTLPPGRYRLQVVVRDVLAGAETRGEVRFERVGGPQSGH